MISVTEIYNYYKKYGYKTEVMGASFRNGGILELVGCDLLTINPALLEGIAASHRASRAKASSKRHRRRARRQAKISYDEKVFAGRFNENQMATEKLSEGIRLFAIDTIKLEQYLPPKLQ